MIKNKMIRFNKNLILKKKKAQKNSKEKKPNDE
jgi:hypothetical protein